MKPANGKLIIIDPDEISKDSSQIENLANYGIDHLNRSPALGWNYILDHVWIANQIDEYLKKIDRNNLVILDIGCGRSKFHNYLEDRYKINIIGIDRPHGYCNQAELKNIDLYCDFIDVDMFADNSVDIIYWLSSIEHNKKETIRKLFEKSFSLLKKGGLFLSTIALSEKTHWHAESQQTNLSISDCLDVFAINRVDGSYNTIKQTYRKNTLFLRDKYRNRYNRFEDDDPKFIVGGITKTMDGLNCTELNNTLPDFKNSQLFLFVPSNDTHVKWMNPISQMIKISNFMIFNERRENADYYLRKLGKEYYVYYSGILKNLQPSIVILGNDWGKEERLVLSEAKKLRIPTVCIQEGPVDFENIQQKRMLTADYAMVHGSIMTKYIKRKSNVLVTGNPKYDSIFQYPLPSAPNVMINSNFTYGIYEEYRDDWVKQVAETCKRNGLNFFISQHPRDKGIHPSEYLVLKSDAFKINEQLKKSTILVTRFSTVIYEAMMMGRDVVYYNPHGETFPIFLDDKTGAISIAHNMEDLATAIKDKIRNYRKKDKIKKLFLKLHCNPFGHNATKICAENLKLISKRHFKKSSQNACKKNQLSVENQYTLKTNNKRIYKPKVSVIIPSYNSGNYILKTLNSVISQTMNDLEIIIIDDGSTDNTKEIIESVKDKRINYIYKVNQGLAAARNTGIRNARGKYITFLDADDEFLPNKLTDQVDFLENNPDFGLVVGGTHRIDKLGKILIKAKPEKRKILPSEIFVASQFPVHSTLIRKFWIDRVGLFDETLSAAEDWDYYCRLATLGCNMFYIDKAVCCYRFLCGSMSTKAEEQTRSMLKVVEKTFNKNIMPEEFLKYENKAKGYTHLKGAVRFYASYMSEEGKYHLRKAFSYDPDLKNDNYSKVIDLFLYWIDHVKIANPFLYIENLMKNLPDNACGMIYLRDFILNHLKNKNRHNDKKIINLYHKSAHNNVVRSNKILSTFKDKHFGKRCFIIGNGPSLNKMNLSFLEGEITFGLNKIFLLFDKWKFRPTYYVSVNPLVIEQSIEEIQKISANKFLSITGLQFIKNTQDIIFLKSIYNPSFSRDPRNGIWEGYTVTYVAMQLAYFMGFNEVFLIGVDHFFNAPGAPNEEVVSEGEDLNHFHPNYFGKGTRWNLPDLKNSELAYSFAKLVFENDGRRIVDATLCGKLQIFPKINYKELIIQLKDIDRYGENNSSEITHLNKQGEERFREGNFISAKKEFEKVIKICPKNATAYNNLGVLFYHQGKKNKAFEYYQKAISLQPENILFLKNFADFHYIENNAVEKAIELYLNAMSINPQDIEVLNAIGLICLNLKKYDDAKIFFNKILDIDPLNKSARDFFDQLISNECESKWTNRVYNDCNYKKSNVRDNNNQYLVSAIISTYNSKRYIRGCLDDLEKQTIADRIEIIVVNSASQENEEDIVRELQNRYKNIKYIRTNKRETVYAAWNRGIQAATGKYITNANTDDRHRNDAFEIMVKALEDKTDIGAVYADCLITESENETFENHSANIYFRRPNYNLRQMLIFSFFGPQPMWRHSVHNEIGYFDETFSIAGDYDFFIRLAVNFGALHINEILGIYQQRRDSVENKNRQQCVAETLRILQKYRTLIPIHKIYPSLGKQNDFHASLTACLADQGNCCLLGELPDLESALFFYKKAQEKGLSIAEIENNIAIVLCLTGQYEQGMELLARHSDHFKASAENLRLLRYHSEYGKSLSLRFFHIAEICHPVVEDAKRGMGITIEGSQMVPILNTESLWSGSEMVKPYRCNRLQENTTDIHYDRVSVIVRTKDRPSLLKECLDSINAQTYRDIEVILVNDGGVDVGPILKDALQSVNFQYKCHKDNIGKAKALNTGLKCASGKYITYLDDDDIIYPEHFETLVNELRRGVFKVAYCDSLEAKQRKRNGVLETVDKRLVYSEEFSRELLKYTNYIPILCLMHRRECMEKIGMFDEDLSVLEDWDYWIRLSKHYDFKHLPVITSEYRVREDGSNATRIEGHLFPACREMVWTKNGIHYSEKHNKKENPLVSIVVITCNQLKYTRKCLDSVFRHTNIPFELIIVDNGSNDGTVEYLESISFRNYADERIKIIKNNENKGFAGGNNLGIAASIGDYIIIMNNDVVVTPGWLERMISCCEKRPEIGIVGPRSNYVSGPQLLETVDYNLDSLEGLNRFSKKITTINAKKTTRLLRVVGFCMLIKRSVINKIGGMDDRFGLGNFEDDDFSLRAALAGFESWMAEDCFVHHFGNRTFIGEMIDYRQSLQQNWKIFKEKWGIPDDLPYGSPYSISQMKVKEFNPHIHYISLSINDENSINTSVDIRSPVEKEYSIVCSSFDKDNLEISIEKLQEFADKYKDFALVYNDLGVFYYQAGNNESALKNYRIALNHDQNNISFRKNLADLLAVAFEQYEEALQHYVTVLASDPKDFEALLATGHICAHLERYDDAAEFYEKVLELDPLNEDAQNWLAKMREKRSTNSLELDLNYRYQTLLSEIEQEDLAGAIQKIENFIELYPNHGQAHNDLGVIYYQNNSKTKVLTCYLKAVELEPVNVTFRKNLADFLYVEEGRVEEALENYVEVLRIKPDDVETLLITGHICTFLERFDDAMSFYHKVLTMEPMNLDARQNMEALKKRQKSMLNQEAMDENKTDEDTEIKQVEPHAPVDEVPIERDGAVEELINKADLLFQQERIDQAVDTMLKAIAVYPSDGRTYVELAGQLVNYGRHENALEVLAEMPTNQPVAVAMQKMLVEGYAEEGMGNYAAAKKCSDGVLAREPKDAKALNLTGILAYRNGDKETAEQHFKRAIELDSEYGESHTNLGALFWEENEPKLAMSHYENGFSISPKDIDVANAYHEAVSATGEYERAEKAARGALKKYPQCRKIHYLLIDTLIKQKKNEEALKELENALSTFGIDEGLLDTALSFRERVGKIKKNGSFKKSTVSLCMIVKDEEANLARCLASVKPIVDEMVVVDTGSNDRTSDISEFFGARVYEFEWSNDFAAARNFSISKAKGDWILIMDADEVISPMDYDHFKKLTVKKSQEPVAYSVATRNYCYEANTIGWYPNDGHYIQEEAGFGWLSSEKVRLFSNRNEIKFEGAVHEMVDPVLKRIGIKIKKSAIPVHHYGRLNTDLLNKKRRIYYEIGQKKLAENGRSIGAVRELAIQATALKKNSEAIKLWKKFLSMKPDSRSVPEAYVNMGSAYIRMKDYEKALISAQKAVAYGPEMKEAQYNLGMAELYNGNADAAVMTLKKLIKSYPNFPPAQFLFAASNCCKNDSPDRNGELKALKRSSFGRVLTYSVAELAEGLMSADQHKLALKLLLHAIEEKIVSKDIMNLYAACIKKDEDSRNLGGKIPEQVDFLQETIVE